MSILVDENLLAIWFMGCGDEFDVLFSLSKNSDKKDHLTITYRFRYYVDDKVFDSKDIKNWYKVTIAPRKNSTLKKMIAEATSVVENLIVAMGLNYNGEIETFATIRRKNENDKDFMKRFSAHPSTHMKTVNESEDA